MVNKNPPGKICHRKYGRAQWQSRNLLAIAIVKKDN